MKPTIPATGYTVCVEYPSGKKYYPVVALVPSGAHGAYEAAVLNVRGHLIPVAELGGKRYFVDPAVAA